ncbi:MULTISPECIES: hypothetical protein [unclassified Psychrobacter]|uniref:hypothetical protein n=2 Tax=Psychrobacter TaxID=497 RepID=UPI001CE45AE7|nr:hypothetical protein [Psychrobacter sp. FME6]
MMNNDLKGSDLTRAMILRGDKQIWCAVCDESDELAMMDHCGNDFTAYIVSFSDVFFYCSGGAPWSFAVPIKISAVMQSEIGI